MTEMGMAWLMLAVTIVNTVFVGMGVYYTAAPYYGWGPYRNASVEGAMPNRPRVWPLVLIGVVLVAISGTATYQMFQKKGEASAQSFESISSVSPCTCTVPFATEIVAYEKLINDLRRIQPPPRHAKVVVENKKYKKCPYAEALLAVLQSVWKNVELDHVPELGGGGLWVESAPREAGVVEVYQELDHFPSQPPQEVHYWGRPGYGPGEWAFYVKDEWKTRRTP